MQNLELFPYIHLHITTLMVWKNNIGEGGIKDFFKEGGGIKEGELFEKGGDKYPLRTMIERLESTTRSVFYNTRVKRFFYRIDYRNLK